MDVLLNNDVETVDFGETAMRVKLTREVIEVKEINDIGSVRILMLKGEKGDVGYPTDEQVSEAVDEWLTNHPEATTTVQDNSLTWVKFNDVLKNMMFKLGITDSKSGELVSTSDAAEFPLKDLQSEITATQNLNGYEYPWVGGAGKNLLSMTIDGIKALNTVGTWSGNAYTYKGITYTLQADDGNNITGILVNGTSTGWGILIIGETNLISDTSYVFNTTNPTPPNMYITLATASWEKSGEKVLTESTMQIEFTATATETRLSYIGLDGSANNVLVQPMIMLSTESDATFTPYSNICPISGRTEVNVTRTGKNWYFSKTVDYTSLGVNLKTDGKGKFEVSGTSTGGWINPSSLRTNITLPVGTYTISASINGTMPEDDTVVGVERVSGTSINGYLRLSPTNPSVSLTFTVTEETVITQGMYAPAGEFDAEITIQIELGSTATAYEPYEGDTFNTELGRTVYGGTLDLTTGVLTVNTGLIASYNGETIGEPWISDRDRYVAGTTPTIGAQVVYTKDSETYQVDRTEVDAYFKNNTIWSDSGDVAISYLVDSKTYIDNH